MSTKREACRKKEKELPWKKDPERDGHKILNKTFQCNMVERKTYLQAAGH